MGQLNMMSLLQHLMGKLAEECGEVSKVALKIQQFGLDEFNPKDGVINCNKLRMELDDLNAILEMLVAADFRYDECPMDIAAKKEKVLHYMEVSHSLGNLSTEALQTYKEYINEIN